MKYYIYYGDRKGIKMSAETNHDGTIDALRCVYPMKKVSWFQYMVYQYKSLTWLKEQVTWLRTWWNN